MALVELQASNGRMSVEAPKMKLLENFTCAICFEEASQTTQLPCNCNVVYCVQCWDRSLAQSFNASGQARCPTCRTTVCVDFDPERVCLVFSRAPPPSTTSSHDSDPFRETSKTRDVQKLRQQALPAQVRLLQNHGIRHSSLKEMVLAPEVHLLRMSESELKYRCALVWASTEDCLEKEDLIRRLLEEATRKQEMGRVLGEQLASLTEELPACVCGSSLVRVSGAERTMRCCDKMPQLSGIPRSSNIYQTVFERFTTQTSICFCDLCGSSVPTANAVWTCKNGDTTILHATSYDVCDECFMRHAALGESMSNTEDCPMLDADMTGGYQSSPQHREFI